MRKSRVIIGAEVQAYSNLKKGEQGLLIPFRTGEVKILNIIAVLVDPDQTPKPRCTIHHEELVQLCRKLTGVAY